MTNTNKFNVSLRWHQLSIVNVNDEPVELYGCLEQICEVKCVVTYPAGASVVGALSLRGHLADIIYSWSKNAFRLFENFYRK